MNGLMDIIGTVLMSPRGKGELKLEVYAIDEIVSCKRCEGTGLRVSEEIGDYHKGIYHYNTFKCSNCDGDGRQIKTTTRLKMKANPPHDGPHSEYVRFRPYNVNPIDTLTRTTIDGEVSLTINGIVERPAR